MSAMQDAASLAPGRYARRVRVETIVRLRWLAVGGQALALGVTHYGLGFALPLRAGFAVIAATALLNLAMRLRFSLNDRLADGPAATLLAVDILQLATLLSLTGGLANPFALLFLAPVTISAVSLPPRLTFVIAALVIAAASTLVFIHRPLPWWGGETLDLPFLYLAGIWGAIALGVVFIGIYVSRVSEEAQLLADALAATELVLAREQHLTQLDGLAAAAAHELGTPLATITLAARELARLVPMPGPVAEDVALIGQEVSRCRTILSKLTSLGDGSDSPLEELPLRQLIEEVVGPHRDFGVTLDISIDGEGAAPICRRNPGVIYGLGNLIENAVDFAATQATIGARWTRDAVVLTVQDDGPGFTPSLLGRIGEPYVTGRPTGRRAKSDAGAGLGLGLFIAKTLLERSGATLRTANAAPPLSGASVAVRWPRTAFEAGRRPPRETTLRGPVRAG